jgi:hypothetical protein
MLEIESSEKHFIEGRGDIYVVDSKYFKKVKKDDEIMISGKCFLIRGIEATIPLGRKIGLIVRAC